MQYEFEELKQVVEKELRNSPGTIYDICKRIGTEDVHDTMDAIQELTFEQKAYVSEIIKAYREDSGVILVEKFSHC